MARFIGNQLNTIAFEEVHTNRGTHFSVNYHIRGIKRDMDAVRDILCAKMPENVTCVVLEIADPVAYAAHARSDPQKYMQLEHPEQFGKIDGIQLGSETAVGKRNMAFSPAQLEISATFSESNDAENFIPALQKAISDTLKDIKQRTP